MTTQTTGYSHKACADIVENRYGERCHDIDAVIALLQSYKANGAKTVSISDGYHNFAFNVRFQCVPNYDSPRHVIMRPVNNDADRDGITRETSGSLE